jgi:hypothetical protein
MELYWTVFATVAVFDTTYAGMFRPELEKSCGTYEELFAIPTRDEVCAP